jgi:hypothetical protein
MKTSLIHDSSKESNKLGLQRASSNKILANKDKLIVKRRSRSKSKSRNEVTKKVEVILEVDQEYKEKSSNWSQASLLNDKESIRDLAKQKGIDFEEIKIKSNQGSVMKTSQKSTNTNK